jgi:hypothetical protein
VDEGGTEAQDGGLRERQLLKPGKQKCGGGVGYGGRGR